MKPHYRALQFDPEVWPPEGTHCAILKTPLNRIEREVPAGGKTTADLQGARPYLAS